MTFLALRRWMLRPVYSTRKRVGLRLESLEGRAVPATFTVTNSLNSGVGSLRQAVIDANDLPGDDTIVFAKAVHNITLTTGALTITDSLDIVGPGISKLTISGNKVSRIFVVEDGSVEVSGLTITRGLAGKGSAHYESVGGAVLNLGHLVLTNVRFTNNRAVGDPNVVVPISPVFNLAGGAAGGAIANFGSLVTAECVFSGNSAFGADNTIGPVTPDNPLDPSFVGASGGGAITNYGFAAVGNSHFIDNVAEAGSYGTGEFGGIGGGGAIYNDGNLQVVGGSFRGNQAIGGSHNVSPGHNGHALGGAIQSGSLSVFLGLPGASLFVSGTDFECNLALGGSFNETLAPILPQADAPNNGFGGGIAVYQGVGTINASSFDGNRAVGGIGGVEVNGSIGAGGGVMLFSFIGPVSATVMGCEITDNDAVGGWGGLVGNGGHALGGGLAIGGLGSLFSGGVFATVANTTISGNVAHGGLAGLFGDGGDALGGGIFNDLGSTLTLTSSSITSNRAQGGHRLLWGSSGDGIGGGVYNLGTFNSLMNVIQNNKASTSHNNMFP